MKTNLAQQLIAECKKNRSTKLDLGQCGLTEIPIEVFDLTWLEELQLSNSYFDYKQRKWIYSENKGLPNHLSNLPNELSQLKKLKALLAGGGITWQQKNRIQNWSIGNINSLKNLNQLTSLDLSYNNISDISILKNLNQLTSLYLSYNLSLIHI